MPTIKCVGAEYHSTDPWNDDQPIHLYEGDECEVSDEKAAACEELDGLVVIIDADGEKPLSRQNVDELRSTAAALGVDLGEAGTRREILAKIRAASPA